MATMILERETLPAALSSCFTAPRIAMIRQRDGDVTLSPVIDPDDYPDTTAYLNAIPGCAERLIESLNNPGELEDIPRPRRGHNV